MSEDDKNTDAPETYEERMERTKNPFYRYYDEHPDEYADKLSEQFAKGAAATAGK